MSGGHAGEAGVAAAGAVEVRSVGRGVCEEGAADQVADAAGFEGAGRLEVFEFEEDAAWGGVSMVGGEGKGYGGGKCRYHPAALERAADSINGVDTQGLARSGGGRLPMLEDTGRSVVL